MLKQTIAADLKQAMLSGDKPRVELLNMLKSAILYKEVEIGARDEGLSDDQIIDVLSKEAKKRQEAANLYAQGDAKEREQKELDEKKVIDAYLPEKMDDDALKAIIDEVITEVKPESMKDMGRVIGAVKAKVGNLAEGSKIAEFVKQKLS
jgi:uncharacterized protein YqeY